MKIKILVVWCVICTLTVLLAFQGGDKKKVKYERPTPIALVDTTILPDTTLAKIDTLRMKEQELKDINEASKNKLFSERIETNLMKQNSSTLEDIVQKEKEPDVLPSLTMKTNVPKYPDSLTIYIKTQRRGLFKRKD